MNRLSYSIELNTGETVDVLELELDDSDEIDEGILQLCSRVPRSVLEEAKIGWTKPLEEALRTPPVGALLRLNKTCSQYGDCPSGKLPTCSTSHLNRKRRGGAFPDCWDHGDDLISSEIVHAWRDGAYVIIVDPTC